MARAVPNLRIERAKVNEYCAPTKVRARPQGCELRHRLGALLILRRALWQIWLRF